MVSSLARPDGNVTGLSNQTTETSGKRVQLLQELLPDLRVLAVIANVGYSGLIREIAEVQTAAKTSGLDVKLLEIRRAEDIAPAFAKLNGAAQALYMCGDALINANHARINTLALVRLPTMHPFRDFLATGKVGPTGANNADLFRRAGDFVDKIFKGAKPADLPVEVAHQVRTCHQQDHCKGTIRHYLENFLPRADEVID